MQRMTVVLPQPLPPIDYKDLALLDLEIEILLNHEIPIGDIEMVNDDGRRCFQSCWKYPVSMIGSMACKIFL